MRIQTNHLRPAVLAVGAMVAALAFAAPARPDITLSPAPLGYPTVAQAYGTCPDVPARMIAGYQPDWQEVAAARSGSQPSTQVLVTLDASGNVISERVWRSSGSARFDNEALRVIQYSRFAPETHNCVAYTGSYVVNVSANDASQIAYNGPVYAFEPIIIRASCPGIDGPAHIAYAYQPSWPDVAIDQVVDPATTTVQVSLDDQGNMIGESVYVSSGNELLDTEALKAARMSSYAPEVRGCARVGGSYLMDVAFVKE